MQHEPRFPLLLVDVAAHDVDEVGALLFDLGAEGVEERDDTTLAEPAQTGTVTLVASFASEELARQAAGELDRGWSPRVSELVGDAWRDAWKKHFVPFQLTEGIAVRPPWEPASVGATGAGMELELEPGRAFGTGLHATTALVARALEARRSAVRGSRVLDVGTGSGILALVALALGAASARATDIDADAIEVARENAARNGMSDRLLADTAALDVITERFDVVIANIEARVLVPLAPALTDRIKAGGLLMLSGVLREQEADVRQAYPLLTMESVEHQGEWIALVLRRPVEAIS